MDVGVVLGALILLALLLAIGGGFDTRYSPAGFEDFDFALGARAAGRKVFTLPDVRVVHRISMRNPREQVSRRVMALFRLRRSLGRYVPERVRASNGTT